MNADQIACLTFIRDNSPSDEELLDCLAVAADRNTTAYSLLKLAYAEYDAATDVWTITAAGIAALGG